MKIRLAALIIVIATLIWSLDSKPDYTDMSATCMGNKGDMKKVVTACTTLMEGEVITPEQRSDLLTARGWAYYNGKRYEDAIADYDTALELHADNATSFLRRALAQEALDNDQEAEVDYAKALAVDPNKASILFHKAEFDQHRGNLSAAVQGYERVLEIDPADDKAASRLVYAMLETGGVEDAGRFLQQAKQRWPKQGWVYMIDLKYQINFTGDQVEAFKDVSEYVRLSSSPKLELPLKAYVELNIGDEDKGIEYIESYAAFQNAGDDTKQGVFIKRWFYAAIEWYLWRNYKELMLRGYLYALSGRPDLAKPELEVALQGFGYRGRKEILKTFEVAGVSVPRDAYAGSADHLEKVISEYVSVVSTDFDLRGIGSRSQTPNE